MAPGERTELGAHVSVNSDGLRGKPITKPKPPGTRRIIIIGDSSVYGHGIDDSATFCSLLDERLGPSIEVINAGVPGYSTEQSLNLLSMRLWALQPDLLIVANMWSDNNFDSFVDRELISSHQAFQGRWSTPLLKAAERSAIYRFLDWHLRVSSRQQAVREVGWMLGRAPQGDRRRVPVNDYAQNLQRMVDQAADSASQVAFLGLANHVDLGAETPGARAWALYRQVMADTAARNSAPLVSVTEAFADSGLSHTDLFLDEMHPSQAGHALIAAALQTAIQPWVDGSRISSPSDAAPSTYEDPYSRGATTSEPVGPGPASRGELQIEVRTERSTPLQIDALTRDEQTHSSTQVAGERMREPGSISLAVPTGIPIILRVYRDAAGDGPGPEDPVISFDDQIITATADQPTRLRIDLDAGVLDAL